ncbi:MAG: hypothetical protein R3E66_15240 [bacterium]
MRIRFFLVFMLAFAAACSDDGDCSGGCPIGEACVSGACEEIPCFGGCPLGETCIDGTCGIPEDQCVILGEACDPFLPIAPGRACIDLDGGGTQPPSCVENCASDGTCSPGGLCFWVTSAFDEGCLTDSDCPSDRSCIEAACRETICRPSECEGTLAGLDTCATLYGNTAGFENGAACVEFENSANYCFPAGTKSLGQTCTSFEAAGNAGTFVDTCVAGLACIDGTCRTPCVSERACLEGQTCLLADQNVAGSGLGFCESTCTAFEVGSCGPGKTCVPLTQTEGVCADAGDVAAFEVCDPTLRNCVDGTVCATYQQGSEALGIEEISRCQPLCNVAIAAAESDGSVSQLAQAARDATCPNPPVEPAELMITNLGTRSAQVDVYLDATLISGALGSGSRLAMSARVDAGQAELRVLPAGSPSTDPALAEQSVSLASGKTLEVVLFDEPLVPASQQVLLRPASAAPTSIEVVNLGDVADVIAVPPGDDLSDPTTQVLLYTDTISGVDLPAGTYDILVFPRGAARDDRFLAAAVLDSVALNRSVIYVTGTVSDVDDLTPGLAVFDRLEDPIIDLGVPRFTCVPLGEQAYGACRQRCAEGSVGYGDTCQGTNMGCQPDFISGPDVWGSYCSPVGTSVRGEACVPLATYGTCAEGLYCDEVGNTAPGFDPIARGRCESLCVLESPMDPVLSCGATQGCRAIDFGGFELGECGTPCDPTRFADPSCPAGQEACLPNASLRTSADGMTAITQDEPTFCSVAGNIPIGQPCSTSDCVATAECLFPRSRQTGFVTSLLSQYVGGLGLESVCTPRCNPFDSGPNDVACPAGQTCLFNFPYNADVGSCAPIVETVAPTQPCTRPGESCGQDSVCVVDGGQNVCYRFCQFTGVAADGAFERSTCPSPLVCSPLINDLGLCLPI